MRTTRGARRLAALTLMSVVVATFAMGCEVIVDFDRTKIDAGEVDASLGEGGVDGAPGDAEVEAEAAPPDASDAAVDAPSDAADASDADQGDASDAATD